MCWGKSETSVGDERRRTRDITEPGGMLMYFTVGGGSGGVLACVGVLDVEKLGAGAGGDKIGSEAVNVGLGVWPNRTHPVGP